MVGLLKSIRRPMGTGSRATMRAAPDEPTWRISSWFGRNRAHKETGYMAAIPERYFQEKTLGLLGASIYAARAIRDAYFYKGNTASL